MQLALINNAAGEFASYAPYPKEPRLAHQIAPGVSLMFVSSTTPKQIAISWSLSDRPVRYGVAHVFKTVPLLSGSLCPKFSYEEQRLRLSQPGILGEFTSALDGLSVEQHDRLIAGCFHAATLANFRACTDLLNSAHAAITKQQQLLQKRGGFLGAVRGEFNVHASINEVFNAR